MELIDLIALAVLALVVFTGYHYLRYVRRLIGERVSPAPHPVRRQTTPAERRLFQEKVRAFRRDQLERELGLKPAVADSVEPSPVEPALAPVKTPRPRRRSPLAG